MIELGGKLKEENSADFTACNTVGKERILSGGQGEFDRRKGRKYQHAIPVAIQSLKREGASK